MEKKLRAIVINIFLVIFLGCTSPSKEVKLPSSVTFSGQEIFQNIINEKVTDINKKKDFSSLFNPELDAELNQILLVSHSNISWRYLIVSELKNEEILEKLITLKNKELDVIPDNSTPFSNISMRQLLLFQLERLKNEQELYPIKHREK